ncbi:MAG TPA: hypothetical protein DD670_06925 [Planctomycetaceae bacterium]|nr:hypothetical protein [Planctomycetaceae bacterium]
MKGVSLRIGFCFAGALLIANSAGPLAAQAPAPSGTVITIAGNGLAGFDGDGAAANLAKLNAPLGMVVGSDGTLYFSDFGNFRIRAIDPVSGFISTIAGIGPPPGGYLEDGPNGDGGPATDAQIGGIYSLATNRQNNTLYLPDLHLSRLRQINLGTGIISNFAGVGMFSPYPVGEYGDNGPALDAWLPWPEGVAVAQDGSVLLTESGLSRLHRIAGGIITPIAGEAFVIASGGDGGPANQASFGWPNAVAVDRAGNIFILDQGSGGVGESATIRRIDAATNIIDTVVGGGSLAPGASGPATSFEFQGIGDLAVDDNGNLFIATQFQVFRIEVASGQLTPYAGTGTAGFAGDNGPAANAQFSSIDGLTVAPGGGLLVSDTGNARIRYIAPDSINLVGDGHQTEFHLPWVNALSGDLTISDNPALSVININSLTTVSGDVDITGNTSATAIDLSLLTTSSGNVDITGNTSATVIDLSSLTTSSGNVAITNNTSATVINMNSLTTSSGSVVITGNTSATAIDLSSLTTSSGSVVITGNTSATAIDLSSLTTSSGDVDITDNTSATVIDMGSLTTSSGNVTITDNTSATVIGMNALNTVSGDLTLETTGAGTFDINGATVEGDTSLTTEGYTEIAAGTAGGETSVTMLNGEATMEMTLPVGAFISATPVTFNVKKLPGGGVETVGGDTITHLETYAFDFAIPTLNSAAELNFEIDLAAMDEANRLPLLDLLHDGALLTLGVLGDAPGAELQLFDICGPGMDPVVDDCVRVLWLDATGAMLDPLGGVDPSTLRFEALVGHFSTYGVVAVVPVPEPTTLALLSAPALLAFGALPLASRRRRREQRSRTFQTSYR